MVAQAQKIEVEATRVSFTFSAAQRTLRDVFEQNRPWLESLAQQVTGRQIAVTSDVTSVHGAEAGGTGAQLAVEAPGKSDRKSTLKEQALADASVQALLEVFPAEIRDVEEM